MPSISSVSPYFRIAIRAYLAGLFAFIFIVLFSVFITFVVTPAVEHFPIPRVAADMKIGGPTMYHTCDFLKTSTTAQK